MAKTPCLAGAVPEWMSPAVWERRYIRSATEPDTPDGDPCLLGPEDAATTVRYLQTPRLFIDIRIPAERSVGTLPAGGLAAATGEDLSTLLAERKGSAFAGLTEVWQKDSGEERVYWHAAYNFFPPNDSAAVWPSIESGRHTTSDIGRAEHLEPEDGVRTVLHKQSPPQPDIQGQFFEEFCAAIAALARVGG